MYECKFPHLFSPLQIGDTIFRNRIFASPTGVHHVDPAMRPIIETRGFYERKARGGAAAVAFGDASTESTHSKHNPVSVATDDMLARAAMNKVAMDIKRHGAVATLEVFDSGRSASGSAMYGNDIYGPQEEVMTSPFAPIEMPVKAMDREMMDRIIEEHVHAALTTRDWGFDMVMLHAGHGWLLHQFMSPSMNFRTDEYGGSFENNMRFPLEVVRAMREAVGPKFPIEMRISGSEIYPGGYGIDYGCMIAEALDGLVDIIHISCGSHEDMRTFPVTHPSMFLEDAVNVKYAAEIKKHVSKSLVAAVGAMSDPALMEQVVATGKADIVELGRGLICDPDLPNKAREGREDEIVHCMRCFTCFYNLVLHGQMVCAINPDLADAYERKYARPTPAKKKVLVVGGGIGGMQAALTCAARGHEVILCEKGERLGGIMRCEEAVPFKKHVAEYLDQQERKVLAADIDVRLGTEVTAEMARQIEPDVIIAAVGAATAVPPIPGIERALSAVDVYADASLAKGEVVILGGGLVGTELAIYLDGLGIKTKIVEKLPDINAGENMMHSMALHNEIADRSLEVHTETIVLEVQENGVLAEDSDGEQLHIAGDTVVNALGMTPVGIEELRFVAPEFHLVGSCLRAGTIYDATRLAHNIALDLGEV